MDTVGPPEKYQVGKAEEGGGWVSIVGQFGHDRFSCFDVYRIKTNRHPYRQTSKVYIYRFLKYIIPFLNPVLSSCPVYNKFTGHILLKVSKFWFSKLDLIRTLFLRKLDFFTGFFHFRQVIYTGLPTNDKSSEMTLEYLFSFFFSHIICQFMKIYLFYSRQQTQLKLQACIRLLLESRSLWLTVYNAYLYLMGKYQDKKCEL